VQKARRKYQQALTILYQCLVDVTFEIVVNITTAKQACEVLQESSQEADNVIKVLLVHYKRMQVKKNMWYLDNRVNNHMCGDKNKFIELDKAIKSNVIFLDHSKVSIKEKCTILIKLKDRSHQFIGDIYYIPTIKKKKNILNLG